MVRWIMALWVVFFLIVEPVFAAQVTAVADRDRIGLGESLNLELRVAGKADDDPDLSVVERDWDILNQSSSSQMQIVNGHMSRSKVISLTLMPKRSGDLPVPAICFGHDCSMPLTIQVAEQQATAAQGDELLLEVAAEPRSVRVGQQVLLTIRVLHRVSLAGAGLDHVQPQGVPADIEQLGDDRSFETRREGFLYQAIERRYALFPGQAGTLVIPRLTLQAQIPEGGGFGSFATRTRTLRRFSRPLDIQVDPPEDTNGRLWLPASSVTLSDSWQQQPPRFRVGEPVTRTLTLQVKGLPAAHLPDLKLPLPGNWKSYPDQPLRAGSHDASGMVGTLQQKIAVVPTEAGTVKLPGFDLDWYDVGSGTWKVARIAPLTVTVAPAAPGSASRQNPSAGKPIPTRPDPEPQHSAPSVAPESKASTVAPVQDGSGPSPWPWVSAGLAAGWLLTLLAWWRRSRRQAGAGHEQPGEAKDEVREQDAYRQLLGIARGNDPAATRQALVSWGQSRWPGQIRHLEQMAGRLDGPLQAEIGRLSRALYSKAPGDWQGDDLVRELKRWRGQEGAGERQGDLPPLYPTGK